MIMVHFAISANLVQCQQYCTSDFTENKRSATVKSDWNIDRAEDTSRETHHVIGTVRYYNASNCPNSNYTHSVVEFLYWFEHPTLSVH